MRLSGATIAISDTDREITGPLRSRDSGRLCTTYEGTRDLPADVVLDLAAQIRTQLDTEGRRVPN
ncbi:hypothetical protein [Streptomyces sp. NPDC007346]|uniref:hypothetical protein n=1 Tax=Streptomyces sp. NPDC007346 TaxID=3154682 RepID=UPI003451554B